LPVDALSANELLTALAELFTTVRRAVARRLESTGVPFVVLAARPIVERNDRGTGSWRTDTIDKSRNVLGVGLAARRVAPWLTATEIDLARDCAAKLAGVTTTLPFWAPLGTNGWELVRGMYDESPGVLEPDENLSEWTFIYVILPALRWHLEYLPSVGIEDHRYAVEFAHEVLSVAQDDCLRYRVLTPLSGIDLASPYNALREGEITIHRLSNEEQGEWFIEHQGPPAFSLAHTEPPQVLLEFPVSGPRNGQHFTAGENAPQLIAAFQLHGYELASKGAIEYSQPRWIQTFSAPVPTILPQRSRSTSTSELTSTVFSAITKTAGCLGHYDLTRPRKPQDLALHRFISGKARQSDVDAVLDYMIGLEALLVPGSNPGDISYRFSLHGAHYLAGDYSTRAIIRDQLSGIYKMRNNLVHGNRYPEQDAIASARTNAQDLLRRGLLRAIHEGFPTPGEFAQMLLGTGTIDHRGLSQARCIRRVISLKEGLNVISSSHDADVTGTAELKLVGSTPI
jgi:hypothetical protein